MTVFRTSLFALALLTVTGAVLAQDKPPVIRPEDEPPLATEDAPDKPATPAPAASAPGSATGAPLPLGGTQSPDTTPDASPASDADQPPAADTAPTEYRPGIFGKPAQSTVTQGDLSGVVDGAPVGTLDETHGGLGQSLWADSAREDIEALLGRMPFVTADPFVRNLSRRVLLTASDAPVGAAKRALIAIRIEKLLQGGAIEDAGTLAASLRLDNDPDFTRVQAEALLYAGRDKDVCGDLTATRLTAPEPFWLQLRAYCFAAAGDDASAELTHAVLDSQNIKDPAFSVLVSDVLTGKKTMPGAIEHPTALHIYLLRKAGLPVTNAVAAKLGTAANLLAARDPRNKPAERLAAAARISATGALGPAETVALLNAQDITPAQLTAGVTPKMSYLAAQSLLRRQAKLESRPPERGAILARAFTAYMDRWPQSAQLQGDLAASVTPDTSIPPNQHLFSRALVLSGRTDAASTWYAGAPGNADAAAFAILADMTAPNGQRDATAQTAYDWFARNAQPQTTPGPLAALALGLNDVLRRPIPPAARSLGANLEGMRWDGAGTRRPPEAEMKALEAAAAAPGRKGEVILRVLDIIGDNGPRDLPADVTIELVRILNQAGLPAEAKALAIEALALQTP